MIIAASLFLFLGIVFGILGSTGVVIFPDIYTRLHASSKCSTTSVLSVLIACLLFSGFSAMTGRIAVIILFFFLTGPATSHIIAYRCWNRGVPPWRKMKNDHDD